MTLDEQILSILRDNITFSGQVGDYVVHGAVEKIKELIKEKCGDSWDAAIKRNNHGVGWKHYEDTNSTTPPNREQYLLSIFNQ